MCELKGIIMEMNLEQANKKIAELLNVEYLIITCNGVEGVMRFNDNPRDSELILKAIEESGETWVESWIADDEIYKNLYRFKIMSDKESLWLNKNKLVNRMQAFLSWKLGESVEITNE